MGFFCEACRRELDHSGGVAESWRLCLKAESIPSRPDMATVDICIHPPLYKVCRFCDLKCLKIWLNIELSRYELDIR